MRLFLLLSIATVYLPVVVVTHLMNNPMLLWQRAFLAFMDPTSEGACSVPVRARARARARARVCVCVCLCPTIGQCLSHYCAMLTRCVFAVMNFERIM